MPCPLKRWTSTIGCHNGKSGTNRLYCDTISPHYRSFGLLDLRESRVIGFGIKHAQQSLFPSGRQISRFTPQATVFTNRQPQADLSNLTLSTVNDSLSQQLIALAEQAISGNQTDELAAALEKADQDSDLKDFYDIGLWGYCSGNKTSQGDYQVTYCSPRETEFYFNPVTVWELNDTGLSNVLPTGLQDAINTYSKVSKWMFIAYVIALVSTAAELLIGLTAILSRLGSLVTSIVSAVCLTCRPLAYRSPAVDDVL